MTGRLGNERFWRLRRFGCLAAAGFCLAGFLGARDVAKAQLSADTARGFVGAKILLPVRLAPVAAASDTLRLRGTITLGNPTVFYPEDFVVPSHFVQLGASMARSDDSTRTFAITLRRVRPAEPTGNDTLFYLSGEALAGSDSVCSVRFAPATLNGVPLKPATGIVITRTSGAARLYVRFAELFPGYPNPAARAETVTWAYRIDKESPVTFRLYDLTGKEILVIDEGERPAGANVLRFEGVRRLSAGAYWIRMNANTGEAVQRFLVGE